MSKKHFLRGLRDGIPIGLGYFAVSFGIGISAHNAHLSIFQGFLLSFLNNASSGEYGGITIIAADSGLWAMALMMLVVNARYLLMSCALSQRLSPDTPLPWRLLIAYDLTDEIFGLAIAQPGYLEVWYYFGTMCAAMPGWSIGTVLGVLMGNLMPVWAVSGCSVMLFGMFLAIIIPVGKQNRIVLGCIGVSFLCSLLASVLPFTRELSEGMRILVQPEGFDLVSGKFYIAKLLDTGETTFKQYVRDAGLEFLQPLNNQFPTLQITDNVRIIGRVVDAKIAPSLLL